jgi:hypothetical protein
MIFISGCFHGYRPVPVSSGNTTAPVSFQNGIGRIRQFGQVGQIFSAVKISIEVAVNSGAAHKIDWAVQSLMNGQNVPLGNLNPQALTATHHRLHCRWNYTIDKNPEDINGEMLQMEKVMYIPIPCYFGLAILIS